VSIVVATSVLAEGIDIPSCGLVLCCLAIGEIISWDDNIFLGAVLQTWPCLAIVNVSSLHHCSRGILWVPKSSSIFWGQKASAPKWKGSACPCCPLNISEPQIRPLDFLCGIHVVMWQKFPVYTDTSFILSKTPRYVPSGYD